MATVSTTFRLTDEMTSPLNRINNYLETTLKRVLDINVAITAIRVTTRFIKSLASSVDDLTQKYSSQYEQEVKLYTIMQQRMGATRQDIESMKTLAKQTQNNGIFNDQMILQGMQEIATFVNTREQIEALTPAIANLTAQQYGYSASGDNMRQVATLIGRLISGNTNGLNKLNLQFTENERKILKMRDVSKNIPIVLDAIENKVGEMNRALAQTNQGKINQLNNTLRDTQEQIGKLLQPLKIVALRIKVAFATKALELFDRALKWISAHVDELSKAIVIFGTLTLAVIGKIIVAQAIAHWKITLLIGAFVALIYTLSQVGIGTEELLGYISGGINATIALLRNVVAFFYNGLYVPIYNIVATLVEGIVTLFTQPGKFIKQFLAGIVNAVLSIVQPILAVWDMLFGTKAVEKINQAIQAVQNWGEEGVDFKIERKLAVEYSNIENAAKQGYQIGFEGGKALKDTLDYLTKNGFDIEYPEGFTFDGSGSLRVTDGELIDIAKDYRELLSKRAVEKFNLQFSQVTPSINIDHVDVHKEADADNVLSTVVDALDDVVNSSLSVR